MILHPFLFSLFPVFSLWAQNLGELSPMSALFLTIIAIVLSAVVFLLSRPVFRTWSKASIVSSTALFLFFSFGHVYYFLLSFHLNFINYFSLLSLWVLIFTAIAYVTFKTERNLRDVHTTLFIMAAVLIALSVFSIGMNLFSKVSDSDENSMVKNDIVLSSPGVLPDIYYIVLDQYASNWTLENFYNYDNADFTAFLGKLGFLVDQKSLSNYSVTAFSLFSALNMDYIQNLNPSDLNKQIKDHAVGKSLKGLGYRYVHFGSEWEITAYNPYADKNVNKNSLSESLITIYKKTALYPVAYVIGLDSWFTRRVQRNRILYQFDELEEIPKLKEPTFTFVHLGVPHAPFVFNRDGSLRTEELAPPAGWLHNPNVYLDQLIFTTERVKKALEKIVAEYGDSSIIVLQSDHGSKTFSLEGVSSVDLISDDALRNHFRNFSAYRLPNIDEKALPESVTPVNIFRIVFSRYFGADLEMLPNISYMSINESEHGFVDVTKRVVY